MLQTRAIRLTHVRSLWFKVISMQSVKHMMSRCLNNITTHSASVKCDVFFMCHMNIEEGIFACTYMNYDDSFNHVMCSQSGSLKFYLSKMNLFNISHVEGDQSIGDFH